MSEFSTLATELITPLLKGHGFKKHGTFTRAALHDEAIYRRGNTQVVVTLQFHPYDYTAIGIYVEIKRARRIAFRKLYPPELGGTREMLEAIVADLCDNVSIVGR